MVYDKNRRRVAEAWGSVPLELAPEQLARDGEDYAIKFLTDTASGHCAIYSDCLATVRCASNPGAAAAAGSQLAHFWAGLEEKLHGAKVVKVKAHLGPKAVRDGRITEFERQGNARADELAKEGAEAVRANIDDIRLVEGCNFVARQAARFAASQEVHLSTEAIHDSMGVGALKIIDLGDWPEHLDEVDTAPSAAGAGPIDTGGSPLPELDGSLRPWRARGHSLLAAQELPEVSEKPVLLFCTSCRGYVSDVKGRGLQDDCPGRPIPSSKNNNRITQGKHPKGGARKLGGLRSPTDAEIEFWSGHFSPERPTEDPAGAPSEGPKRPSILEALQYFGLQLAQAQRLGSRALEARAKALAARQRGRSAEPEDLFGP